MMKATDKRQFMKEHEEDIIQYKAAEMYFSRKGIDPSSLKLSELFEEYRELKQEKITLKKALKPVQESLKELSIIGQNIEEALGMKMMERNKEEEQKRGRRQNRPVR